MLTNFYRVTEEFMPRALRYFESGGVYEICFRAKNTLPLVCNDVIKFVVQSILSRVQRDDKVTICHYIFNGSHPHIIVVCKDANELASFYGELQKQITDVLKCLLGIPYLSIWEGKASVIRLGDIEAVKDRIAYLYSNPANDNLEESIEQFPGLSTWKDYQRCQCKLTDSVTKSFPWIRLKSIPRLSSRVPSTEEGLRVIQTLKDNCKRSHRLTKYPNAWMKSFGIKSDKDVADVNSQIVKRLRNREEIARVRRARNCKTILGATKLRAQPILKLHTPQKRDIKICIISTCKETRMGFLRFMSDFTSKCRDCYQRWKRGELSVKWPAGAFRPPLPPIVSILAV